MVICNKKQGVSLLLQNKLFTMNGRTLIFLFLFLDSGLYAVGQKVFIEGDMIYKVTLQSADNKEFTGTYTFVFKGNRIRKELRLNNGYQDVVLLDCGKNKAYSLQKWNGKKYAIELSMEDIRKKQEFFDGFTVKNEENNSEKIAGYAVYKGDVKYHDGSNEEVLYTKEWQPSQAITFERFPDARFLPLYFSYKDENGVTMLFEAEKIEPRPVENAEFRIPPDYKIITNAEYKQLSR
jgi:hypothetical protein